jgi:YVTN family beta-propeller protein
VTMIQGTTIAGTVPVGFGPYDAAYDPANGDVYVPNFYDDNVSVINGTKIFSTIDVGSGPTSATYEPSNGHMLVTNAYSNTVSLVDATGVLSTLRVGTEPVVAAFNPSNGWTYVANQGSNNVSVILFMGAYAVTISETGILQADTSWAVDVNGTQNSSYHTSMVLWEPNGSYALTTFPEKGYYVPNASTFEVDGAPVPISLTFVLVRYFINFTETGLAPGLVWNVTFDGITENSTSGPAALPLSYFEPDGTYAYTIGGVHAYKRPSLGGSIDVSGASQVKQLAFTYFPEQFLLTFAETGLISGTSWNVTFNGTPGSSTSPTISFTTFNGSYAYSVSAVTGYTANPTASTVTVDGTQARVSVVFTSNGVGSQSSSSSNILGLSPLAWAGIIVLIVVVAVVAVVLLKRKSTPPPGPADGADSYVTDSGPEQ